MGLSVTQLVTIFKGTIDERLVTAVVPQGWSGKIEVVISVTNGKPGRIRIIKSGRYDREVPMEDQS